MWLTEIPLSTNTTEKADIIWLQEHVKISSDLLKQGGKKFNWGVKAPSGPLRGAGSILVLFLEFWQYLFSWILYFCVYYWGLFHLFHMSAVSLLNC